MGILFYFVGTEWGFLLLFPRMTRDHADGSAAAKIHLS